MAIPEEIEKLLFEKDFNGDYRAFFIALINEVSTLNRHMSEVKQSAIAANKNVALLFARDEKNSQTLLELKERDTKIEKTSNLSLKISVFALFLIVIIGWQTTPLTMDRIAKATSWIIEKL